MYSFMKSAKKRKCTLMHKKLKGQRFPILLERNVSLLINIRSEAGEYTSLAETRNGCGPL